MTLACLQGSREDLERMLWQGEPLGLAAAMSRIPSRRTKDLDVMAAAVPR